MPKSSPAKRSADVVIVGGGVMGCACAWELARAGARVLVLERSVPGAEASSAAAGILGAQIEAHGPGPTARLALLSRARYARWVNALVSATGIDVGYRECGLLKLGFGARAVKDLQHGVEWQRRARLPVETIDARRALALEPALNARVTGGVRFVRDARVEPPLLLRALHIAAQRTGAAFQSGAYVRRVIVERGRASGIALDDGSAVKSKNVVIAAGSWTTLIGGLNLASDAVRPVRGQIVELVSDTPPLRHVVFGPRCYLVPRDDGRTLVGSTLEFVGYRREVTAGAVRDLLDAAIELVPSLAHAQMRSAWSNFRPYTGRDQPLLGPAGIAGVTLATGHFRNGILLAPITAEIVAAIISGHRPPLPLSPFSPKRLPESMV
jgi:glycine oxidase